jgi:general secretion pathway protein H
MRILSAVTNADRSPLSRGFSLVELMVALVIVGLAATTVVLTLPSSSSDLADEAARFAARAAALRDRAVVEARPMRLWVSASGYGFEVRQSGQWAALNDRTLRPDDWPEGVTAQWNDAPQGRLAFDRLGLPDGAGMLTLGADDTRQIVRIDAAGNVQIGTRP